jgi:hypothetical protein
MVNENKYDICWDQNLSRVTSFLTTNGQIQIQLCGLFITSIAFLTAFSEKSGGHSNKIFLYIVPIFSILIFSLSLRVYIWVSYQLTYLSIFGRNPKTLKVLCTYESFKEMILINSRNIPRIIRILMIVFKSFIFLINIIFRLSNIYYLYFLLYIITIPLSVIYGGNSATPKYLIPVYTLALFAVILISIKDYVYLNYFLKDIKTHYINNHDQEIPNFK